MYMTQISREKFNIIVSELVETVAAHIQLDEEEQAELASGFDDVISDVLETDLSEF
jgi:hypothetical protein